MIAQAAAVPFHKITDFLRSRKMPGLEDIISWLDGFRDRTQAAVILNALDPREFKRAASGQLEVGDLSEDPIVEACLMAINRVAPLDLDAMSMRFEGGDHIDELYPACYGYPLGWDEWDDMVHQLDNQEPDLALYVFITAQRMDEGKVLAEASEHYGWDLEIEDIETLPDPNWDRLFELLDAHDLSVFKNAINACLYSTDNPYFDYNPWDEGQIYELPRFTLEGVNELEDHWQEAQPILKDLRAATERFAKYPNLAKVLMMLYEESSDEPKKKPQTLAELWAGEQDAPAVDPFYGPIGADLAEDEEEEENGW